MDDICEKVKILMNKPQPEQRTPEWFEARKGRVTASAVASLLVKDEKTCKNYVDTYGLEEIFEYDNKCCNCYSNFEQFKLDKVKSTFKGSPATYHGQKFEPIATCIYELMNDTTVIEFGLLAHDTLMWLAASPDGITPDGIMLEIKCPYRRKITGIPPMYYYQQVQIQLEVADLEYCDFLEIEFKEFEKFSDFVYDQDQIPEMKGCFIQYEVYPHSFEKTEYFYPDKEIYNNYVELKKWAEDMTYKLIEERSLTVLNTKEGEVLCRDSRYAKYNIKTILWKAMTISNVRIKRDREWFATIKDFLKDRWDQVLHFKENYVHGTEPEVIEIDDCLF